MSTDAVQRPWPLAVLTIVSWCLCGLSALALIGLIWIRLQHDELPHAMIPAAAGLIAAVGSFCSLLAGAVLAFTGRRAEVRSVIAWSSVSLLLYAVMLALMWYLPWNRAF